MTFAVLGLGSNLGESPKLIRSAFEALGRLLSEARLSRLWRSRPRDVTDQPDYVNAVACGLTGLSPRELLASINLIEAAHGRDRGRERRRGPRTLDIDILLYGECLVVEPDLVIPHPAITERKFVLLPLLELCPDLAHPATGRLFAESAAALPPQGIYLMESGRYDRLYI